MMKRRHVIAGTIVGVLLAGSLNLSTSLAAQWVCPNGDENCPGQEYCVAHQQCVEDGYCTHSDSRLGINGGHCRNTQRKSQSSHHGRSSHHNCC